MLPVTIKRIFKKDYEGYLLPIEYTTDSYYDVSLSRTENGWKADFSVARFPYPVTHTQEEFDYPDKLFQKHWKGAYPRPPIHIIYSPTKTGMVTMQTSVVKILIAPAYSASF